MNVALNIGTHVSTDGAEDLKGHYLVSLKLVERLHRLLLDVIKDEFERVGRGDVNSVQALLLYNIGDAELTAGELTSRGYYFGSNVSYNVKKMVENDYLIQERSPHDRRSFHVRASDRGLEIFRAISGLFDLQAGDLARNQITEESLAEANKALRRLQQYWSTPAGFSGRSISAA